MENRMMVERQSWSIARSLAVWTDRESVVWRWHREDCGGRCRPSLCNTDLAADWRKIVRKTVALGDAYWREKERELVEQEEV